MAVSNERIPQEQLSAARRRLARHIASVILGAMSENDTSFTEIAVRTGSTEKAVRKAFNSLADGNTDVSLDRISDVFWSIGGCSPKLSLRPIPQEQDA